MFIVLNQKLSLNVNWQILITKIKTPDTLIKGISGVCVGTGSYFLASFNLVITLFVELTNPLNELIAAFNSLIKV